MQHHTKPPAVTVESAHDAVRALHAELLAEARSAIRRQYAAEAVSRVAGDDVDDVEFADLVDVVVGRPSGLRPGRWPRRGRT